MAEPNEAPQEQPPFEADQNVSLSEPEPFEEEGPRHPERSHEARNMAMLCHLLGLVGFIAPLMIWLIEKDKHRFVYEHGREAMNYQISLLIYAAALCLLVVGVFLLPVLLAVHIVLSIVGAVKASRGQAWCYPIAIPFLK